MIGRYHRATNEEAKLKNELEHFDRLPLRVSYPAALAPCFKSEHPARPHSWSILIPDLPRRQASGGEISAAKPQPDTTQPVQLPAKVEDDTVSG